MPCASLGHPFPGHSLLSDALPITACRGPVAINKRSRVQQLHLATQPQETVNELFKGYAACQDLALAFQRMKLERARCMLAQLDYADALLSRQRPDARIGASHHQLAHPTWRQVWLLPIAVTAEQLRVGRRYLRDGMLPVDSSKDVCVRGWCKACQAGDHSGIAGATQCTAAPLKTRAPREVQSHLRQLHGTRDLPTLPACDNRQQAPPACENCSVVRTRLRLHFLCVAAAQRSSNFTSFSKLCRSATSNGLTQAEVAAAKAIQMKVPHVEMDCEASGRSSTRKSSNLPLRQISKTSCARSSEVLPQRPPPIRQLRGRKRARKLHCRSHCHQELRPALLPGALQLSRLAMEQCISAAEGHVSEVRVLIRAKLLET